jgi:hypothetical protein
MAAKWPPRSNSLQCAMLFDNSAKRLIGGAISYGNTATPVGTVEGAGGPHAPLPYTAAVVELAERPRLMTTIAGADPADLRIGMPLRAVPVEITEGVTAFVFSPAS